MRRRRPLTFLALGLSFACGCGTPEGSRGEDPTDVSQTLATRFELLLSDYVGEDKPGACLLVRYRGADLFEDCYGMADLERGLRADPQTNFRLASLTKQLTATAVIQLVEAGKLGYEVTLTQIFPGFPDYGKRITVRHLLTHTSGLIDYESLLPEGQTEQVKDADVLRLMTEQDSTYFEPGSEFRYSNSAYALLAMATEQVSGQRFADFLADGIFTPLGMAHTVAHEEGVSTVYKRAYGYARTEDGWEFADQSPTSAVLGDGGVYSSLQDLGRWMQVVERRVTLIEPASLAQAFSPMRLSSGDMTEYGFGWYIDEYKGNRRYRHSGSTRGFRNGVQRLPELDVTVVFLSNRNEIGDALVDSIVEASVAAVRSLDNDHKP
jgi:CubicO group peptidase (beta-lactamase class C family)